MIIFWVTAGALCAAALAFVLPPLVRARTRPRVDVSQDVVNVGIYRDQLKELDAELAQGAIAQEQYRKTRAEIERRVLEESGRADASGPVTGNARGIAAGLAVAVPALAFSLYLALGTPRGLDPEAANRPVDESAHQLTAGQIGAMIEKLAARLREEPGNVEGWVMLARSYGVLGRYQESAQAYARASALLPQDAQIMADHADAVAMSQGRKLDGEPERLIAQALRIDPSNVKARLLAGTVSFQRRDFRTAIDHWRAALARVPDAGELSESIKASIAEAEANAGTGAAAAVPFAQAPAAAAQPAEAGKAGITGTVTLAPGLASRASPEDVVFIFARPAEGARMPLAIVRKQVRDLPLRFRLDDSLAMSPAATLSAAGRVMVGARISKSGNAMPKPGDLEGMIGPVAVDASGLALTIDRVVQ